VYGRLDVAEIFRVVRLKPFSEVDTPITRGHADVVGPADMLKKFHVLITFQQRLHILVDVVYDLTKCSPPLGRKVDEFVLVILYFHRYDELALGFFDGHNTITRSSELINLHSVDVDVVTDVICRL